jgi:hypothetical protein
VRVEGVLSGTVVSLERGMRVGLREISVRAESQLEESGE